MMIKRKAFVQILAVLALCGTARAEYPESTITMIVPLAAGGGTDVAARMVAKSLEKEIRGQIVVQNRTGSS